MLLRVLISFPQKYSITTLSNKWLTAVVLGEMVVAMVVGWTVLSNTLHLILTSYNLPIHTLLEMMPVNMIKQRVLVQ